MMAPINKIVESEQSKDMTLSVGGNPVYLDKAEDYSKRINILFPIAVLVIGLLHLKHSAVSRFDSATRYSFACCGMGYGHDGAVQTAYGYL
jgi:hypothetical protein